MLLKKFAKLIVIQLSLFAILTYPVLALDNLSELRDTISTSVVNQNNVQHEIGFQLPSDAMQIQFTDYIIVDLNNFSNVTAPTSIEGTFIGTPIITVQGPEIKITGIVVLPGISLKINGVTATNPANHSDFLVTIIISEDEDGLIIKNIGTMFASTSSGEVSVSATIIPPVATLSISGYSAPGTFVTFTENGTVIGTDTAGLNGYFSKSLQGLDESTHRLRIYGVDQNSRATAPVFLDVYTPLYQVTSVTDLLLPPTIELESDLIVRGDDLVVSGSGVPDSNLSLFTESPLKAYSSTISNVGDWNYTITDTVDYLPGDYRVFGLLQMGALQSGTGTALGFTVLSDGGITPTPANCNIAGGDLNCDTNIDLFDFSVLMFYWGTMQSAGDINSDGSVDLYDFSILMYYWGT